MTLAPQRVTALVCFALKEEAAPFLRLVSGRTDLQTLITGVGLANAARAARAALECTAPDFVLSCGYAGGSHPALPRGAVVFEADHGFVLRDALLAAGGRPARFCSSARIVGTAAEKRALRETTGADAVEMESAAIRRVCQAQRIPCAVVRVISDTADEDLPLDFNQFLTTNQEVAPARLALAVLRSPGRLPGLLRLQRHCRLAARRLAQLLIRSLQPQNASPPLPH